MNTSKNPTVGWLFKIVGIVLALINAVLTFQFGSQYFSAAFTVGIIGQYLAGFYALLIMDIAYVTWFAVHLRNSTGKNQRSLAALMAAVSLIGSILATVNQLIVNSFGLADFTQYQEGIGTASLIAMIILTAAHIIAYAAFIVFDPQEQVKTQGAETLSEVIEDALSELKLRMNNDKNILIDHISAGYRVELLTTLGFTSDLQQVGKGETLATPSPIATVAASSDTPAPSVKQAGEVVHSVTMDSTPTKREGETTADFYTRWSDEKADYEAAKTSIADFGFNPLQDTSNGAASVNGKNGRSDFLANGGK